MFSNFRSRLAAVCSRAALWFVPCAERRAALFSGEVADVPGALPGYSGPALSVWRSGMGVVPIAGFSFTARAYLFFSNLEIVLGYSWSFIWRNRSFIFWCMLLPCFQR